MCVYRCVLLLLLSGLLHLSESEDVAHHAAHRLHSHKNTRRHRATTNDAVLHFEPEPYNKRLELNSTGKIHCKVAGGVAPNVTWYLNKADPLPEGMSSTNGTLAVSAAAKHHAGSYTCRATDGDVNIEANITIDVVVSPRIVSPTPGQQYHVQLGQEAMLDCVASGDPPPTTHWDRNLTVLHQQDGVSVEGAANASSAKYVLLNNGSLLIRGVADEDTAQYGCTAGSAAGLARHELLLFVHPEGEMPVLESHGVGGKAVVICIGVAAAYMVLVLVLTLYCRRRKLGQRQGGGEKLELEMVEGREKLVGEEDKKANGVASANGRLLPHDRDSGPDNSEVSGVSRVSKKSGQFDHLSLPRTLLTDQITLGRGEFGEVLLAKIDMKAVRQLKNKEEMSEETEIQPVLVKALTTKHEIQLAEFRRQLEMFSRVRHENVARLIALCNEREPHYMLLEHTDWGDLKSFLFATRTPEETAEYLTRVGPALPPPKVKASSPPLAPAHQLALVAHLAAAGAKLASKRITHRDIAARNCLITSKLQLKLSYPALTRGPDSHEYHKLHDQVIPLRWLPLEAVAEGEYSTKSDVYMFAATVWEIYTKAELPFAKLNDNSVLERLKNGTLEWTTPPNIPEPLANLLKQCWQQSPAARPQFTDICETMTTILKEFDSTSVHSQDKINEET